MIYDALNELKRLEKQYNKAFGRAYYLLLYKYNGISDQLLRENDDPEVDRMSMSIVDQIELKVRGNDN